jgi:hypothetical protein
MPDNLGTATASSRGINPQMLDNWFKYHAPRPDQQKKYEAIREAGKELAATILENTPPGPDQSAAIRQVREACMTANQSIACDGG